MKGTTDWESFLYLGIPICKNKLNSANWDNILDKIKSKIQCWSANWLNTAGKTILLKAILNSMPVYHSSIILAHALVIHKMEGMLRKFLWEGGKGNEKKIHLISWKKIQKPRYEGGLQVRSLSSQNLALGAKLLWKIVTGKDSWSKKALMKK